MQKKSLQDLTDLRGKRVLIRVDFNVPLDDQGEVSNDRRIRSAVPTIKHVLDAGAAAIVMSHLGRPKGDPKKDAVFRMDKVAERLKALLTRPVIKVDEVVGPKATAAAQALRPGEVLVLDNLRFHPGEQAGDPAFAAQLAALGEVYVNDAFGTCHRTDASMYAVPKAMAGKPRVAGFLVAKELQILGQLLSAPSKPVIGVMGGAKVSDKIGFIKSMLARVDQLLVGGAMTYTFMKALGMGIGNSRVEADKLDVARELLQFGMSRASSPDLRKLMTPEGLRELILKGQGKIAMPIDHLVAEKVDAAAPTKVVDGEIPDGWIGLDIGPKTITRYVEFIADAGTVVWNGPMGKFEDEPFRKGTRAVAEAMAKCPGTTIVGGGETAEAVEAFGLDAKITHVSTGGGAFLEYVEGTPFKALEVLDDK